MKVLKLKDKIRENTLGTWMIIDSSGLDEAYNMTLIGLIDLEHSAIDFSGLHKAILL